MDDFLPKNEREPVTSNYMKFEQGDNKFRVLSKPIIGWEYWTQDGDKRKPNRVRTELEVPAESRNSLDNQKRPKYFWAMVVWNYQAEKIQILEITQKSIRESLKVLFNDPDWGKPFAYDIVINKTGEGLETEYHTNPKPKKDLDDELDKLYKESNINLEALYDGGDPFGEEVRENIEMIDESEIPDNI